MEKKLQRDDREKMIAGVCSGLAEYFGIDVSLVRIAFVLAVMFGAGVVAYIILWIVMPVKPFDPYYNKFDTDYKVYDHANTASGNPVPDPAGFDSPYSPPVKPRKDRNGKVIAGILFICFGCYFLLDEFHVIPYWFELDKLWPLVLIIPGLLLISRSKKESYKNDFATGEPVRDPMPPVTQQEGSVQHTSEPDLDEQKTL